MENLTQTRCSILPSIETKRKTKTRKHSCRNNACSQWSVTRQTDAIGLRKYDHGVPSHLLPPRYVTTIRVREFLIAPHTHACGIA
jgi:hypothetical protein